MSVGDLIGLALFTKFQLKFGGKPHKFINCFTRIVLS